MRFLMSSILKMRATQRWDWPVIVFTILAGMAALLFFMNLYRLSGPWGPLGWDRNDDPCELYRDLRRWHEAMWGAVTGILSGGVLLSLLWRPREKPLLIQFVVLMLVTGAATILPFEPTLVVIIVPIA